MMWAVTGPIFFWLQATILTSPPLTWTGDSATSERKSGFLAPAIPSAVFSAWFSNEERWCLRLVRRSAVSLIFLPFESPRIRAFSKTVQGFRAGPSTPFR